MIQWVSTTTLSPTNMNSIQHLIYGGIILFIVLIQPTYTSDTPNWLSRLLPSCTYNPHGITELSHSFHHYMIGQSSAVHELLSLIQQHIDNTKYSRLNPDNINYAIQKPLVLSLHGLTGTGKSLSAQLIINSLYHSTNNPIESGYVYKFHGKRYDTPNINRHIYDITTQLKSTIQQCSSPIYIFEEIHYMSSGVLDGLLPYMDYRAVVDGISYNSAIFILTSNYGGQALQKLLYDGELSGYTRDTIPYDRVKATLNHALIQSTNITDQHNNILQQRNKLQLLIDHSVINRFIPFYPLYKSHIKQCIQLQLNQLSLNMVHNKQVAGMTVDSSVINHIANKLQYRGSISMYGCKNIHDLITIYIQPIINKQLYRVESHSNGIDGMNDIANSIYKYVHNSLHGTKWSLSDKLVHLYMHPSNSTLLGDTVELVSKDINPVDNNNKHSVRQHRNEL